MTTNTFFRNNQYPTYDEVNNLLIESGSIELMSEYGQLNHRLLKLIWDNIDDKEVIINAGKSIDKRGGFTAMQGNFYTFIKVLQYMLKKNKDIYNDLELMKIGYMNKNIEKYWDGIGNWKY